MKMKTLFLVVLTALLVACSLGGTGEAVDNPLLASSGQEEATAVPQATVTTAPVATAVQEQLQEATAAVDEEPLITIECNSGSVANYSGQTQSQPTYANENLRCANFVGATLSQPDMAFSDFSGASFVNATLSQPDIVDTDFTGADFTGATIVGGDIVGADFTGADFRGATLLNNEWFGTICPDGQLSDAAGGTCLGNLVPVPVAAGGQPPAGTSAGPAATPVPLAAIASLRPLSDEWYIDSDGNAVPDFMELELGYDPFIDDCAPSACTAEIVEVDPVAVKGENVLVILDASGSMAQGMGGQTRMDAAKDVLTRYVSALPSTAKLGFMVYGHEGDNTEAGKAASCAGVELLAPVGGVSVDNFQAMLDSFTPNGWTPIASSLTAAEGAFAGVEDGVNKVVLVTDGLETCGGDPVAVATQLNLDPNIQLIVDVLGFSISNEGERLALRQIAEAGGGAYHDIQTVDAFSEYLRGLVDRARARTEYAVCIGEVAVGTNMCSAQLVLATNMAISERVVELTMGGGGNEVEIAALQDIQAAIDEAENRRFEQYLEWENEHLQLLAEMEALDEVYYEMFPIP